MVYWGLTFATGGANNLQQFRFNYELLTPQFVKMIQF